MAGAGGGRDALGDQTISAFERDLLGWIDCREPAASTTAVVLGDLYTTGDCIRMATGDRRRPWTLYLTNRQRIGPFDRYRTGGWEGQYEMGLLRSTGLLAGLASGVRYDVIPADNSLELSIYNSPYNGDLFRPGDQLTPWSRPNINGFNRYPAGFQPYWHAVDNIRHAERDSLTLVFDYRQDFRRSPVIRRDSWIGAETEGQRLTGRARVKSGSLTIETHVQLAGRLVVENGATLAISEAGRLVVEDASTLILHMGSRLVVDGSLHVDGVLLPYADSSIETGESGRLTSGAGRRMR